MFTNIGSKIKIVSKVVCWVGIIASFITAVVMIVIGGGEWAAIGIGFCVLIGGSLVSWLASMFSYGFGELIDNTTKMVNGVPQGGTDGSTKNKYTVESRRVELERWRSSGLITEEEYQEKKETLV